MKFGIISDAHGNVAGLSTCLDQLSRMAVDQIIFLGDVGGYFPDVHESIELLRNHNVKCLLGNHDAMMLGSSPLSEKKDRIYQLALAAKQLTDQNREYISTLKPWYEVEVDDKKLLFVHGSPRDPLNGYIYPDTDIEWFDSLPYDSIFMGHTHRPFVKKIGGDKLVVNVGSCGLSRDQGDLLSFALYDSKEHSCEVFRIKVNVEALLCEYEGKIHKSVEACLNRKNNEVFGRGIDATI